MKFKPLIGAAAGLLLAGQAHALNIGGITFDPGVVFQGGIEIVVTTGGMPDGLGEINTILSNGGQTWASGDNGVDLFFDIHSYVFGDSFVSGITTYEVGTGGKIDFYTLPAGTFDISSAASLAAARTAVRAGTLWLNTVGVPFPAPFCGHPAPPGPHPTTPVTVCTITNFIGVTTGFGPLDVAGGPAAASFDTNAALFGLADIAWNFSHQGSGTHPFGENGTGNFQGNAVPAPEPGVLGLLGLGLVGVAAASRRKRAA
jgi:hypothetical protein